MSKFAIRSISKHTMALPSSNQNRYYGKNWSALGAKLVSQDSKEILTFKTQTAAENFIKEIASSGFNNIRVQELM